MLTCFTTGANHIIHYTHCLRITRRSKACYSGAGLCSTHLCRLGQSRHVQALLFSQAEKQQQATAQNLEGSTSPYQEYLHAS